MNAGFATWIVFILSIVSMFSVKRMIDVPLCPIFRLGGIGRVAGFPDRPFTGLNLQRKLETWPPNGRMPI
jgi:hypothetical protein